MLEPLLLLCLLPPGEHQAGEDKDKDIEKAKVKDKDLASTMAVKSQKAELDVPSQLSMYSSSTFIKIVNNNQKSSITDLNRPE